MASGRRRGGVQHVHRDFIAGVHEQGLRVGSEGSKIGELRARRPGRNAVRLDKGEVDRFLAVAVATGKPVVHSRLSMLRAAHQCVLSQLVAVQEGGMPGG